MTGTWRCEQLGKLVQRAHIISRSSPTLFSPSLLFHSVSRWPHLCSMHFFCPRHSDTFKGPIEKRFFAHSLANEKNIQKEKLEATRSEHAAQFLDILHFLLGFLLSAALAWRPFSKRQNNGLSPNYCGILKSAHNRYPCNLKGLQLLLESKNLFTPTGEKTHTKMYLVWPVFWLNLPRPKQYLLKKQKTMLLRVESFQKIPSIHRQKQPLSGIFFTFPFEVVYVLKASKFHTCISYAT